MLNTITAISVPNEPTRNHIYINLSWNSNILSAEDTLKNLFQKVDNLDKSVEDISGLFFHSKQHKLFSMTSTSKLSGSKEPSLRKNTILVKPVSIIFCYIYGVSCIVPIIGINVN